MLFGERHVGEDVVLGRLHQRRGPGKPPRSFSAFSRHCLRGRLVALMDEGGTYQRGGKMIQRSVSAALLDAEQRFRRVRGFRDMPRLMLALYDPSAQSKQPEMAA